MILHLDNLSSVEGQANPEISIKTEKCNICPKDCISQPEPGKCCPTCHCGPLGPRDWDPSGRSGEPQESQLRARQKQAWWFYDKKCICNKGVIQCDDNAFPPSPFRPKDCQEPNDPSVTHQHGHEWTNPEEECESCECRDGQITCSKRCPELNCPNEQYPGMLIETQVNICH
ncbi:Oidioi.mRNA.OKI2018_I69.chr2.g6171.t1.cds [Oikopleura dioica]|uniref:Oidioi.mRNA.OKI2018_I69.chr2.g6171.t1.cds n=1 Tax=Oikopleura dioica TaxID=34765 RepID=A0ABN7T2K5_OIKDI|nr:Oidioi.mRNA.OKI2018_I69.chr2.g6171.t1.cds [Oikopleura dioica]